MTIAKTSLYCILNAETNKKADKGRKKKPVRKEIVTSKHKNPDHQFESGTIILATNFRYSRPKWIGLGGPAVATSITGL